jgi:hypothetical protein
MKDSELLSTFVLWILRAQVYLVGNVSWVRIVSVPEEFGNLYLRHELSHKPSNKFIM